ATRSFLSKYAGLLLKGQDRVLGYHMDSQFYGTDDFVEMVKNGLAELTLADVNSIIKNHLQTDNIQFVFITSDAKDLKKRLVSEQSSPMEYNSEKPNDLLEEDSVIQDYPLELDQVEVINIDQVFD
ncbi:MAG: insulinase family protein, partial [Proteobacteria bacterium]